MYCDAKRQATCLLPSPVYSPEIRHITQQKEIWLSEIKNGMKVTFIVITLIHDIVIMKYTTKNNFYVI